MKRDLYFGSAGYPNLPKSDIGGPKVLGKLKTDDSCFDCKIK